MVMIFLYISELDKWLGQYIMKNYNRSYRRDLCKRSHGIFHGLNLQPMVGRDWWTVGRWKGRDLI